MWKKLFGEHSNNPKAQSQLFKAVHESNLISFVNALNKGAQIENTNSLGQTVLHTACNNGNKEFVREIVLHAPHIIDSRDKDHRTPLMIAARCNHLEIVKLLIEKGADIGLKDKGKCTALTVATGDTRVFLKQLIKEEVKHWKPCRMILLHTNPITPEDHSINVVPISKTPHNLYDDFLQKNHDLEFPPFTEPYEDPPRYN